MNFQPKSEKDLSRRLLPDGIYDFEIMEAEDKVSKEGNEMIELKIGIWEGESIIAYVFDHLLEKVDYRLRHASDACGLLSQYETGKLQAAMFEGRTGKAKLRTQKDKTGQYPDKNIISDYIKREPAQQSDSGLLPSEKAMQNDKNRAEDNSTDLPF